MNDQIKIRDYNFDDYAFVKSSWIKNQSHSKPYSLMLKEEFFNNFGSILDNKIKDCMIYVICNPECEQQTYGYIAYDQREELQVIHFIYIKGIYRGLNISDMLIKSAFSTSPTHYTHQSDNPAFRHIVKKFKLKYNPFLFLE